MSAVIEIAPPSVRSEQAPINGALESPVVVDPITHPNWDAILADHADASFFHSSAWARVLIDTYGHTPNYFCRFAGGRLKQLLAVMEVTSPLTGRRGVSLPFADFCSPLTSDGEDLHPLYEFAAQHGRERNWRYLECRGAGKQMCADAIPSLAFFGHIILLKDGEEWLFRRMDAGVRRAVRRAQQHGVTVEFCNSSDSIGIYYALHCQTRRRHGVPPQPFCFFENLQRHVIAAGKGVVVIARAENRPIAAAVFLHEGRHALYKFGASELEFQHLRPNNLLMWEAVKHYFHNGFTDLHMGRTSLHNEGLRRFKLGFGAEEERIEYTKHELHRGVFLKDVDRASGPLNNVFRHLPPSLLCLAGRLLYRHLS
ncbi:MAG TPA: GNAT family N-acetyltransferase [Verrucomicrobiae bacterium]|nr:GNAT family N-acetyltransferase [Verrucomicrobiae bacterium]